MTNMRVYYSIHALFTYLLIIFEWPFSHPWTLSGHVYYCQSCWDDKRTESGNPRHSHSHSSHPRAIVLAMKDCVDNFEVTFQCNDHKTDLCGVDITKTVWDQN